MLVFTLKSSLIQSWMSFLLTARSLYRLLLSEKLAAKIIKLCIPGSTSTLGRKNSQLKTIFSQTMTKKKSLKAYKKLLRLLKPRLIYLVDPKKFLLEVTHKVVFWLWQYTLCASTSSVVWLVFATVIALKLISPKLTLRKKDKRLYGFVWLRRTKLLISIRLSKVWHHCLKSSN